MVGIRVLPDPTTGLFNYSDFNNVAVLRYDGAEDGYPSEDPSVNVSQSKLPLVETNLHVSYTSL